MDTIICTKQSNYRLTTVAETTDTGTSTRYKTTIVDGNNGYGKVYLVREQSDES